MPDESRASSRGPNCYQCRHFAVSWDPTFPYLCRLMGFKSRALPAIEVLRVDGVFCQGFEAKPTSPSKPDRPVTSPPQNRGDRRVRYG
jgi:hypothetical protein